MFPTSLSETLTCPAFTMEFIVFLGALDGADTQDHKRPSSLDAGMAIPVLESKGIRYAARKKHPC